NLLKCHEEPRPKIARPVTARVQSAAAHKFRLRQSASCSTFHKQIWRRVLPMDETYVAAIQLLQRIHRLYLDILKWELERLDIHDINNSQSIILINIGDHEMTVSELTSRGIYLGSNVAYNVRKMAANGYLAHERSQYDRRVTYVRATEKGRQLREAL